MKKKIHILPVLLFISLLSASLFTACDKDTNSYVDVLVVNEGNRAPVSGVKVEFYQNSCSPSDYNYTVGVTDENGIFSTYFVAPAILSIKASLTAADGGTRYGYGTVRLVEGETKTATITLEAKVEY